MNDTVKLIIEIPKEIYARCKEYKLWSYDAETLEGVVATSKPLFENKGKWIEVVTGKFPNGEKRMWHYECSACSTGEPPCPINKEHWDFCPNCGADMRGKAE